MKLLHQCELRVRPQKRHLANELVAETTQWQLRNEGE